MIPELAFTPTLQQAIRDRFLYADEDPFSGRRIYFENAGGGLTLKTVLAADQRINSLPDNAGRNNPASREVERVIKQGKADVATLLNATDGTILSEQSTTACAFRILTAAAEGMPGTNMVCSCLDHASFHDATGLIASRHGLERRLVPLNPETGALDSDAIAGQVDHNTVSVSVIHASNITGGKNKLADVVTRIRQRAPQAIIIADGAQHVQHGVVDVTGDGVDAYVFSAYKVFSKVGMGFAYLSPRLAALPHVKLDGKSPEEWDLGTRDPGGFAAFSSVVDYFAWLADQVTPTPLPNRRSQIAAAMQAIEAHEATLSRRLLEGAEGRPGLRDHPKVVLHGQKHHCNGREAVFAFSIPGVPTGRLVQEFGRRGIVLHDRVSDAYSKHTLEALGVTEIVRISMAHYNTSAEVDAFLQALEEILAAV